MSSKNPIVSDEGVSDTDTSGLKYEVFLSFRGPDTRTGFTDHLYVRLVDAGFKVYRDNEELRIGEKIGQELLEGIKQSKIAIPIFSKGYASSKWCLKELAQIVECMKTTGLKVMPIFYDVTPSDVRNQTGDYEKAFQSHVKCYGQDTINTWRKALRDVGELKGWDIHDGANRHEGELVKEITNTVVRELKIAYLKITNCLVGLEHDVEEVLSILTAEIGGVKIIAIHGIGGMGKTTLGKIIYNHLLPQFQSHIFLADIRESVRSKGMKFLQEYLISNIQNEKSKYFSTIDEGIEIINTIFLKKKVLLLLDDVDEILQLQALIARRDLLGRGTRIIITTRNKGIFDQFEVDRFYELSGLDSHQALRLFCRHAFQSDKPPEEYAVLSQRTIEIARGLPLALQVFGSLLRNKSIEKWVSILQRLENIPHEEVSERLKISYEALTKQQRKIFLDIACFFAGENKKIVIHFWDESECPEEAIEVLQQMSIIKIQEDQSLWMHDHLRDLGREIVRQEHEESEGRSRLWNEEEATKLLKQKLGRDSIRGIKLNFQEETKDPISTQDFERLPNLRLLHVRGSGYKWQKRTLNSCFGESPLIFSKLKWLSWHRFPHKYDISNCSVDNLVMLDLSYSKIKSSWSGWSYIKVAKNLKVLNLTGCKRLVRTPNFSTHLKLERLILRKCSRLVEIDESIRLLKCLIIIDLAKCHRLRKLPKVLSCTETLEEFIIDNTHVEEIPNWAPMKRLRVFSCCQLETITDTSTSSSVNVLVEIDEFFVEVFMEMLNIFKLKAIETLLKSVKDSASLIELDLSHTKVTGLPDIIGDLKNLKVLKVRYTPIRKLPAAIGMLENLTTLDAEGSDDLHNIPKLPQSLISLKLNCGDIQNAALSNLINLKNLGISTQSDDKIEDPAPWWIGRLTNLESLKLNLQKNISLHADLGKLSQLTKLELFWCYNLESIPILPPGLKELSIVGCGSLGSLLDLPSGLAILDIVFCESLTLLDLSYLRKLGSLIIDVTQISELKEIRNCDSLQTLRIYKCDLSEIDGLEMLENLNSLGILECEKLQRLPDLSNLKKLRTLEVRNCPKLIEIPGTLESLNRFSIYNCKSLGRIPDIPNSKTMDRFHVEHCGKIKRSSV